jgi:hypothetical protein
MQDFNLRQMPFQLVAEFIRKYCDTIFLPLAVSDHDLIEFKIDILDPQAYAFHQAQSAAVKQASHEGVLAVQTGHEIFYFQGAGYKPSPLGGKVFSNTLHWLYTVL